MNYYYVKTFVHLGYLAVLAKLKEVTMTDDDNDSDKNTFLRT